MKNSLACKLLRLFCKDPQKVPASEDAAEWTLESALKILRRADPDIENRVRGKAIVDFGSGVGYQSAALLEAGAAKILGLELSASHLETSRALLRKLGLSERGEFLASIQKNHEAAFDLVISQDAMEHYSSPEEVLKQMHFLLKPGGCALITFGPPWYAPYGAHMQFFTRLPWIQLLFSERTIMAVRSAYRSDGAEQFHQVPGGLNKMTIRRFEQLLTRAGFTLKERHYECVRRLNFLGKIPLLREFFINHATALLVRN